MHPHTTPFRKAWVPPTPKRDPLWKRIALFPIVKDNSDAVPVRWIVICFVVFTFIMVGIYADEVKSETLGEQARSLAVQTAANHFRSSWVSIRCEQRSVRSPLECYAGSHSPAFGVASKIELTCTHTSCTITSKPSN